MNRLKRAISTMTCDRTMTWITANPVYHNENQTQNDLCTASSPVQLLILDPVRIDDEDVEAGVFDVEFCERQVHVAALPAQRRSQPGVVGGEGVDRVVELF